MVVDCRDCKFFIPISQYNEKARAKLYELVNTMAVFREKECKSVKGYCTKLKIPICYYEGNCRYFTPKEKRYQDLRLF